jgi:hypothetical protein
MFSSTGLLYFIAWLFSKMDHFNANIEKKKVQKQTPEARNLQRKEI